SPARKRAHACGSLSQLSRHAPARLARDVLLGLLPSRVAPTPARGGPRDPGPGGSGAARSGAAEAGGGLAMKPRAVLILALALGLLATSLAAEAQQAGKTFRLGLLATNRPTERPPGGPALSRWTGTPGSGETIVAALIELGYVEGRNIVIERR